MTEETLAKAIELKTEIGYIEKLIDIFAGVKIQTPMIKRGEEEIYLHDAPLIEKITEVCRKELEDCKFQFRLL